MFNECAVITHGAMNCDLCQTFTNYLQQTSSNVHVWQAAEWVTSKILLTNFMKARLKSLPTWSPTDTANQDSHHDAGLWCLTLPPGSENKASFTHQTISRKSVKVMNTQAADIRRLSTRDVFTRWTKREWVEKTVKQQHDRVWRLDMHPLFFFNILYCQIYYLHF